MLQIDYQHPDYVEIYAERQKRLMWIRKNPDKLPSIKRHYELNRAQFISDWGMTTDPRNADIGLPVLIPFILFPRQFDWIEFVLDCWKNRKPGITEKSRECGVSWLAIALSCTLSLQVRNLVIGFGSRKEEYVDKLGAPKALFYKARIFMQYLPPEFRGGWMLNKHAPHMRIEFPETGATITGEAGDNIGRGDRTALYFVDESAHLERPELIDSSLSSTTNCRQDISSVNGSANPFAMKARGGKIPKFTFSWRDDPRKNDAWYAKQCEELDPVVVAQEIDINYDASVEGIVIPQAWVQAAVGLLEFLKLEATGLRTAALDVADRGIDKNALAWSHGCLLLGAESWSGKESDIFATTERAFMRCDELKLRRFDYDGDGLGAGVRGDARKINEKRKESKVHLITADMFRGSGAVLDPELEIIEGRKNEDFFANRKAQAWWSLRYRFQESWRARQGLPYNAEKIISIARDFKERDALCMELSQPVYKQNLLGKIVIDKAPDGVKSPNLADAVMMVFAPKVARLVITEAVLQATGGQPRR